MSDLRRIAFYPEQMARTLGLTPDQVKTIFRDGRSAAAFAEHWAARSYGFTPRKRQQERGTHLVRVMTTRGVDFTPSGGKGKGRSATWADVQSHIQQYQRIIVVDVSEFPVVVMHEPKRDRLQTLIAKGKISVTGISRREYYELCVEGDRLFDPQEFDAPADATPTAIQAGL